MKNTFVGQFVVVRTFSAGVHYGKLVERDGQEVLLAEARRIWKWEGALTLHELASIGLSDSSKVSVEIPNILITEVIEVIPASKCAQDLIARITWR